MHPPPFRFSAYLGTLRLCVTISLPIHDSGAFAVPCIPGNALVAASLRASVSALHCLRGHLATSSWVPSALARFRSFLSPCFRSFFCASAAISAKASRETQREDLNSRRTGEPRANRAPRNPLPLRGQRRQPQGSPHPRQNQQRARRPPIRPPQFQLQPLL